MNNLRNLKLWLSTEMVHTNEQKNIPSTVKRLMAKAKSKAGNFLDLVIINTLPINAGIERRQVALRYENCTVNLELLTNKATRQQTLSGLSLN